MPKPKKYWAVMDEKNVIDVESIKEDRFKVHERRTMLRAITGDLKLRVIPVAIVPYEEVKHEDR